MNNEQFNEWQHIKEKGLLLFIIESWKYLLISGMLIFIVYLLFRLFIYRDASMLTGLLIFIVITLEDVIKKIMKWNKLKKRFQNL
jgi:hypothetical protein